MMGGSRRTSKSAARLQSTSIMSNSTESNNTGARALDDPNNHEAPSKAEVISTVIGWLRTVQQAWGKAEGHLRVMLESGVEGHLDEARQTTVVLSGREGGGDHPGST